MDTSPIYHSIVARILKVEAWNFMNPHLQPEGLQIERPNWSIEMLEFQD